MPKHFYFAICTHLIQDKLYILRLVVQKDAFDILADHYFEYGCSKCNSLSLDNSLWSADPDALLDHMPPGEQFHASMDIRQFLRADYEDALDGSLMTDDFEIVLHDRAQEQRSTLPATHDKTTSIA